MNVDGLDSSLISKLITQHVEQVTCLECCRYYIAPETAPCGHSLCHGCWTGRRACPSCAAAVTRRTLRLNVPLRTQTGHVQALADAFERLFNIKLDEIDLDILVPKMPSNDPTKHVKEWLASSQNHFSAPPLSTQTSPECVPVAPIELNASKIQIHTHTKKNGSPQKVIKTPQPQEDWDKIETIPDTENIVPRDKENIVGPMDIEPFICDENEYNNDHPRRSNRKKELVLAKQTNHVRSIDKISSKNSDSEMDNKSKTKQNWSNVKKMKKEFNKLNRVNKSKLNVSIEMCKKAQDAKTKVVPPIQPTETLPYNIEDDTPDIAKETNIDTNTKPDGNDIENIDVSDKIAKKIPSNSDGIRKKSIRTKTNTDKQVSTDKSGVDDQCSGDKQISTEDSRSKQTEEPIRSQMPVIQRSVSKDTEVQIVQNELDSENINSNTEDVEISIKIGNTVTHIHIKQKHKDVTLKVNADSAIQTSLGPHNLSGKEMCDKWTNPQSNHVKETSEKGVNVHLIELELGDVNKVTVNKSNTTKLDTASADTVTAQDMITDTVEKELSEMMDCVENDNQTKKSQPKNTQKRDSTKPSREKPVNTVTDDEQGDIDELNDLDLFASGSVKEANVHLLKNSKAVQSEILKPTLKSLKPQKVPDKRDRDVNDDLDVDMPSNKKQKVVSQVKTKGNTPEREEEVQNGPDSEALTYDNLLSQVFANIDADIESEKKSGNSRKSQKQAEKEHPKNVSQVFPRTQTIRKTTPKDVVPPNEVVDISDVRVREPPKDSENVFSMIENEPQEVVEKPQEVSENPKQETKKPQPQLATNTQQNIDNILTPGMCRDLDTFRGSTQAERMDVDMEQLQPVMGTPMMEDDDSDKSVVEETPQKNISFQKPKPKSDASSGRNVDKVQTVKAISHRESDLNRTSDSQVIQSIINITDTLTPGESKAKDITVVDNVGAAHKGQELTTPLTITKFFNQIKHNSTPVARKSLNFESDDLSLDDQQTLCPTTTQEKEFMAKAFEKTPPTSSSVRKSLSLKNAALAPKDTKNYCLAGSCLSPTEILKIKILCRNHGWTYVDKYTDKLTHLVVAVDNEGKSQRTVKYMCALAASKWIVSFAWVERSLATKAPLEEEPYEALDANGDPGPLRSRLADQKLFHGILFYCVPPFSILDLDVLSTMIVSAGGAVARTVQEVRLTANGSVRLLLGEPEATEEDRFIYLCMEHGVVPVNYEWVLNCLGSYQLFSIKDQLLCPPTLLPKEVDAWPAQLIQDSDDGDTNGI